ncbi:MAG: dihydroorotase [Cyclobacteriaceae bacterium]
MNIRLRNVKIIDPGSELNERKTDLFIYDGKIRLSADGLPEPDRDITYQGLCVSPGWFDLKAFFSDPGHEYKEDLYTGAACAQDGGFTDVLVMPNTDPVIQNKNDIKYISSRRPEDTVRLHATGAVTIDTKGEALTEMLDMYAAGAVAFTDGLKPVWNADILLKTLQYLQKFQGVLMTTPSDKYLSMFGQMHEGKISTMLGMKGIPALSEEIVVMRDIQLLTYAGGKLHFSGVSTQGALRQIEEAKQRGLSVTCDVSVAQLSYTEESLLSFDTNYKSEPPFRSEEDRLALVDAVRSGLIDAVVSSHQPQDEESKKCEFDLAEPGVIALQTVFPMLVSELGSNNLDIIVKCLAYRPRQVLGMEVPAIREGSEACLTLFHPDVKWIYDLSTNLSKSQNSPLLGQEQEGKALGIIAGNAAHIQDSILTQPHD